MALVRKGAIGAVLVAVAALGVGACSDDDGGDRLTAEETAARGDAVCNRFKGEVTAVASEYQGITFTPQQMQDFYGKLVPKIDAAIEDFDEISPPADLQDELDDAVAQARKDRQTLVDASKSQEAAQALYTSETDPFEATNEKLGRVGITACSEGATDEGDAGEGAEGGETTTSAPAESSTTSTP